MPTSTFAIRSDASISSPFLTLEWSPDGLSLLENQTGKTIFHRANSRLFLYDGSVQKLFSTNSPTVETDGLAVTIRTISDVLGLELCCSLEGRTCKISLRITNHGPGDVQLGDAQILVFDRQAGSQSHLLTDPCDVFSLGASTGETDQVWSKDPGNKRTFALRLSQREPSYTSDNLLAAQPVDALGLTPHVVFSFDRIADVASGVSIDLARGLSVARAAFRGATLPGGCSRSLPDLFVDGITPIQESLAAAADRVSKIYRPPIKESVPAGWCSWYYYYAHVSEEDILENLDFLSRKRDRFPYPYVQIDDGYQLHWGDWLLPGQKFPHDMAWLAARIKAAGLKPGIWVAPLIATVPSHLFQEHPEWALRDFETGEPQTLTGWSPPEENPWVILDGTHPEFLAHLKKIFHTMAHEWGFEYFKLDATAFGAYEGLRYDPTRTGIQGVRMALQAIREAIGPDKYILGCGVPFGAAIGLVNGERVSDDVSTAFCKEQGCCPIEVSMPQTLHRSFIHGKWWHNDPDCVLVRSLGTPHSVSLSKAGLSLDEAQFFTTVIGMSQGIQMVGEKMGALDEERLRLLDMIQPSIMNPAMPMDIFETQPSRILLHTEHGNILGLLNWQHTERSLAVDWSELGLATGEKQHVYELWTRSCLAADQQARIELVVPAHGARVLYIRRAISHPSFLGFDGHISCGTQLMSCEVWNAETSSLSVHLSANRDGVATFHVPHGWQPLHPQFVAGVNGCWNLQISKGENSLKLDFEKR